MPCAKVRQIFEAERPVAETGRKPPHAWRGKVIGDIAKAIAQQRLATRDLPQLTVSAPFNL